VLIFAHGDHFTAGLDLAKIAGRITSPATTSATRSTRGASAAVQAVGRCGPGLYATGESS